MINNNGVEESYMYLYNGAKAIFICVIQGGELYAIDSIDDFGCFDSVSVAAKNNIDINMQSILMYILGLRSIEGLSGLSLNTGLVTTIPLLSINGYIKLNFTLKQNPIIRDAKSDEIK